MIKKLYIRYQIYLGIGNIMYFFIHHLEICFFNNYKS